MAIRGFSQRSVHSGNARRINSVFAKSVLGLLVGSIIGAPALAADLTTPEAQAQLERSLTQEGINYTVMHEGLDSQRIIMNGSSNLAALRKALYSLPAQQGFLRGSTIITLSGRVPKDKTVQVILESNLATGYSWGLADSTTNLMSQDGDSVYESRGLLGGTAKQTILVKAIKEGSTETNLVYRRPWEKDNLTVQAMAASAPNKITIQLDQIPDVIDLSDPNAMEQAMPEDGHKKLYKPATELMLPTAALPAAWDWRTSGAGLTPVRDQGQCGSCWAFATVGALESAFKVKMGSDVNASEQFLVSCNSSGYSCNGGWFAHDYHANTLGKLQTAAGAVAETTTPYTASNGSCNSVSNHPYRISSWSYIAGYTVPSIDQIKNAIYNYGSVAASICVGSAFQRYTSGVFSTDESAACGSNKVNHAIVLVGWDDVTQTWILRNSWGPSWAEQGYMRIKYGTSNVGFGANYVQLAQGINQSIGAISFTPATLAVGGTTTASATATSQLAVNFSSKTPTVCTVSGSSVKGVTAGTCTLAADQAGNASYNPAPQVTQNLTVGSKPKTSQTLSAISFSPATLTVGGTTTASATASSKLAVSFSSKTTAVCTVSSNAVKGVAAGTCTIAADQAGDATYNAAPQVTQNLTVGGKTSQSISAISFTPATLTVGGTTTANATATSKLAVVFSSKTPTVCTVSGSSVKGVTAGTCTLAADQAGNASYNPAPQVTQNLTVGSQSYTLTVGKAGTGSGTVITSPAGINCGATCSAKFNNGTTVTLTATVASGSTFAGWNNKGCTGTPATCTVVATFNKTAAKTAATASAPSPSLEFTPESLTPESSQ